MEQIKQYLLCTAILCVLWVGALAAPAGAANVRADFNGDGFQDLAIGVPGQTIGGDPGAGAVSVIYGTADGLSSVNNQFWHQDRLGTDPSEPGDSFGSTLAAGDFNGDGFADLAIGVPSEDLVSGGVNVANAGAVHILFGSAAGLTGVNDQFFNQDSPNLFGAPATNAFFGAALAVGVSGQNIAGNSGAGGVQILIGSASGLSAPVGSAPFFTEDVLTSFGNSEAFDHFGQALASGDFNNDGFNDLAIGVPGEDFISGEPPFGSVTDAGQVYVVYGSILGLNSGTILPQQWTQDIPGILDVAESGDAFGSVLAAGRFNGDGRDDLAVGVPAEDIGGLTNTGAVNVIYGSSTGLTTTGNQFWHQDVAGIEDINEEFDNFGASLAAGDFNNDNRDDLAIGIPFEDVGGVANGGVQSGGAVAVIYGSSVGLTATGDQRWTQDSVVNGVAIADATETSDNFGATVAAGDFNGDGFDDLAIGVPFEDFGTLSNTGAVNVIYGTAAGLSAVNNQFWDQNEIGILDKNEANDRFGAALTGLGSGSAGGSGLSGEWENTPTQHCGEACRIQGNLNVFNPATAVAEASVLRFFLSTDETLDEFDTLLQEETVRLLAPEQSVNVKLNVRLAEGLNAQGSFVIAVVDATNVVPEVNEENNIVVSPSIQ